jgi:hypothetical protein
MKMEHGLPGPRSRVDHQPIAPRHSLPFCHLTSNDKQPAKKIRILAGDLIHALDVLIGDDKDVCGRLRVAIVKGGHVLVLVDDAG